MSQVFARYFTAQYKNYMQDIPFWIKLADTYPGGVLELGCGSGRVLFQLTALGHPVTGIDNDPEMLTLAQLNNSQAESGNVILLQADISNFDLQRRYSLVISPCNTFSYLNNGQVRTSLACIHRHLHGDHMLALDLPNPDFLLHTPVDPHEPVDSFIEPCSGNPVQVSAIQIIQPDRQRVDMTWYYDELLPDGIIKRLELPIIYYLRRPAELEDMLKQAGFAGVSFFGGYEQQALGPDSERMVVLARS